MKKLKVLSISFDKGLFDDSKDVSIRHEFYKKLFEQYTVVVFTLKSEKKTTQIRGNLTVIPTNSISRFFYIYDCLKIVSKTHDFDLITTQDPFIIGLAGVLIKFLFRVPLNIQIHSEFFNTKYFREESAFNFLMYLLGKFNLFFADTVRARNLKIRCNIEKNYPRLIKKIGYVGARLNEVYLKPLSYKKRDKNLIVASARLVPQKNLPMMFDVIKRLTKKHPKILLALFDVGPLKSQVETLINKKHIENNVKLMGWQPPEIYVKYLEKAVTILITSNHEGWSLVALESLSRGTPVVMTDTGCAGEIVIDKRTGFVVPIEDIEYFVAKIEAVLSRPKESRKMAQKGRELVLSDSSLINIKRDLLYLFNLTEKCKV